MTHDPHQYQRVIDEAGNDSLGMLARYIVCESIVLELGPAQGYFSRYLKQTLNCTVDAVELDPAMAEHARPWCRNLVVGNLEELDLATEFGAIRYDVIVLADVMEHLRDPSRTLQQAVGLLAENGQVLISVPNVGYAGLIADLLQDKFIYRAEGLLDCTHLRFFTRASLAAMLVDAGLYAWQFETMERPLWESEFRTRLENLPAAWAETLLAKPDPLCYQWIVSARLARPPEVPSHPDGSVYDRFPVRLFWHGHGEEFTFSNSQVVWGEIGRTNQTLSLNFAAGNVTDLRLRLADRPAFLRVRALSILDDKAACHWKAATGNLLEAGSGGMHEAELNGCSVLVLEETESWVNLPVPVPFPEGNLKLEITLDWPMSGDYVALLPKVTGEIAGLRERQGEMGRTIAERDELIAIHQERIKQREGMIGERDALLTQRNGQLEGMTGLIEERDALLMQRTGQLESMAGLIDERDVLLTMRTAQLESMTSQIEERDVLLTTRTGQIETLTAQIEERDTMLALRTRQFENMSMQIEERDGMLAMRTGQFESLKVLIVERDRLLTLHAGQFDELARQIAERDGMLAMRTDQLNEQNLKLNASHDLLRQRADQISLHEQSISLQKQQLEYRASLAWWLKFPVRFIKQVFKAHA